jgi:hypothetical protein
MRVMPNAPRASVPGVLIGIGVLLVIVGAFGATVNRLGVVTVSADPTAPLFVILVGAVLLAAGIVGERRTRA